MKNSKLLKTLLIPALGISAIGMVATISTSCRCALEPTPVDSVTLRQQLKLGVGDADKLVATVLPETATDKSITWSSSNESIATVDANGKVTAKSEGEATITVTSKDNPNAQDTCEITVVNSLPYVAINAFENSTLELINNGENNPNLSYSYDDIDWNTYSSELSISAGQSLYLKGNNSSGWSTNKNVYSTLSITGNVSLVGNVMDLLDNGAGTTTAIPVEWCFFKLFQYSTGITSVSENFLPAKTLKLHSYDSMFQGCSALTTSPNLPAKSLPSTTYKNMFDGCSSLVNGPIISATNLGANCMEEMFKNCSSLSSLKLSNYVGNWNYVNSMLNWVLGVSDHGIMYSNNPVEEYGSSAIPVGWTKMPF